MDGAALLILERTLELAAELMPDDVRVKKCSSVIREYFETPDLSDHKFDEALVELLAIAREHQQFLIVARCQALAQKMEKGHRAA